MGTFEQVSFNEGEHIYADTNIWLSFLGYNQTGSDDAKQRNASAKLISAINNAGANIVVSTLILGELRKTIVMNRFKANDCRRQEDIKRMREIDEKKYNYILGQALNDFESYRRKIMQDPAVLKKIIAPTSEGFDMSNELMRQYNLFGSMDASQLATALEYGIDYFATFDKDFSNVVLPDITILWHDIHNT